MANSLLDKVDLDDVLRKFSVCGRYHAVAAIWMSLGLLYNAMCFPNYVLIIDKVRYSCDGYSSTYSYTNTYNFSHAQNLTIWCRDPHACAQWRYEDPDSFVAEFQLACQDWKRTLVGTAHIFGYMTGIMIVGSLSDRFGRRTLAVATGVTCAVCGIAKSFVRFYWIYIAMEFLEGAIGDAFSPTYMLALEMVSSDSRVTYLTTILSMGIITGGLVFTLIRWLVPYWRTCLRVTYAPGLLYIFLIYLLDESPTWLLAKGEINATVKNIERAAKLNKTEIKKNLNMLSYEKGETSKFSTVIADTFKSRVLLKRFFVCIIWWNTCTFIDYGLILHSVFLQGNKYVNFALSSFSRLPAELISAYLMLKYNRKGPLMFCFVLCAILSVGQPYIPKNIHWLVITMYMASKVTSSMFFKMTHIFTSELFPTYTRNSMQALCSSLGRFGGIIATQMPLLMIYWSDLPMVIFGVTALIAALVTLLVPDTAKTALPNTVRQAEALGASNTRTR